MRRITSLVLVLALLLMASFTAMAAEGNGGTLKIGIGMDVKQLDPAFISDLPSERIASQIHDRLLRRDPEGNIKPNLAKDWKVEENAKVWTFYLKEDVKFTDGSKFNAEVVKWHFDRLRDSEVGSNYVEQFSIIEKVKVLDNYTVQFRLKRPYGPFVDTILFSPGGLIPSKNHFEKVGADAYSSNPVGTGPFEFKEWKPGSFIKLTANDNYHREEIKLDGLTFKPIPEPMTRIIELQTGGVDVVKSIPYMNVKKLQGDSNVDLYKGKSGFYTMYIWFNLEEGSPFKDNLALRKAVAYSINKKELAKVLHGEYSIRCEGYVPKASWAYPDNPEPIGYDLDKAKQILKDAGYTYEDGKLYKDGERVTIEYLSTTSERQWQTIAQFVQERLRKLGVEAKLKQLEWGSYLDKFTNRKYTLSSMGWSQNTGEPSLFLDVLISTEGRGNFSGYSNPEVDKMLKEAAAISGRSERMKIYRKVYDILEEDLPMVPILSKPLLEGVSTDVENYIYSPYVNDYTDTFIK